MMKSLRLLFCCCLFTELFVSAATLPMAVPSLPLVPTVAPVSVTITHHSDWDLRFRFVYDNGTYSQWTRVNGRSTKTGRSADQTLALCRLGQGIPAQAHQHRMKVR